MSSTLPDYLHLFCHFQILFLELLILGTSDIQMKGFQLFKQVK